MNLHDLETFVSIARLGGLTRAAGQLHRSQPAITRRIKLLEDHLGAPLFERGRHGAMLTEAGRTFLSYASVLAALKDGTQAVQALRGGDHGAVSLAIVGTLAGTTIVEQLRRFSAKHRNARLELRTANSFEVSDMVRRGEVSLGLRYFADPSPELVSSGAPARILAFGGDPPDLDGNAAVAERRNAHAETVAELERLDQVLAQMEVDPHVGEIDQGHQRHAGRDVIRRG